MYFQIQMHILLCMYKTNALWIVRGKNSSLKCILGNPLFQARAASVLSIIRTYINMFIESLVNYRLQTHTPNAIFYFRSHVDALSNCRCISSFATTKGIYFSC